MGLKNFGNQAKERARETFNVPVTDLDYASERITFGAVSAGVRQGSFGGVSALIEGTAPSGCYVELWLPKIEGSGEAAGSFDDSDYFYSGKVLLEAGSAAVLTGHDVSYGSATWSLAGYPGAQIRVKSGGAQGPVAISASAN